MNYIGAKKRLLPFLEQTFGVAAGDTCGGVFADFFACTGAVGAAFQVNNCTVITNDLRIIRTCPTDILSKIHRHSSSRTCII